MEKLAVFKDYISLIKKNCMLKNVGLSVDGPNMLRKEFNSNFMRKIIERAIWQIQKLQSFPESICFK